MEHVRFNIDCDNPNDAYRLLKSLKEFWAKPTNGKVKVTIIKSDNSIITDEKLLNETQPYSRKLHRNHI